MNCPLCGADSGVIDSRPIPRSEVVRRRECECGARWSTREVVIKGSLTRSRPQVIGANGRQETPISGYETGGETPQPVAIDPNGGVGGGLLSLSPSGSDPADPDVSKPNSGILALYERPRRRRRRVVYTADFLAFWRLYPNRVKKPVAAAAWEAERPDLAEVLAALSWQTRLPDWLKEGGRFVPHPSTYINQRRWEDEPPQMPTLSAREARGLVAAAEFVEEGHARSRR